MSLTVFLMVMAAIKAIALASDLNILARGTSKKPGLEVFAVVVNGTLFVWALWLLATL